MNIYYNCSEEEWGHIQPYTLIFGKNNVKLSHIKLRDSVKQVPFLVKQKESKVGPLIGILCGKGNSDDFSGNKEMFREIQYRLSKGGGISFVFTPEGIENDCINGYYYIDSQWMYIRFPIPDLIYNRIRTYKDETNKVLIPVRKLINRYTIPYFNPHFFDKWDTFVQLNSHIEINKYLPPTAHLSSKQQFSDWIDDYNNIYVKPVLSNQGKGIFKVCKEGDLFIVNTNKEKQTFQSIDDLWNQLDFEAKINKYIIQKSINLLTFEGSPYDYRVLVQRIKDHWSVTGIGVRCARKDRITTHVPNGGRIISLDQLDSPLTVSEIEHLVILIARKLEIAYGYLGEFSLDIGKDEDQNLWVFEVNSKPMKFDELHIYNKAMNRLIDCFYEDTHF